MIKMFSGTKKCKTLKKESYKDVEKATYLWFLQEHSRGTPISGLILSEKALHFFCQLRVDASIHNFKASQGWLDKFK